LNARVLCGCTAHPVAVSAGPAAAAPDAAAAGTSAPPSGAGVVSTRELGIAAGDPVAGAVGTVGSIACGSVGCGTAEPGVAGRADEACDDECVS
jgi:hypothetical protein